MAVAMESTPISPRIFGPSLSLYSPVYLELPSRQSPQRPSSLSPLPHIETARAAHAGPNTEPWIRLLTYDTSAVSKLTEFAQSGSLEPHPVSGDIEAQLGPTTSESEYRS